MPCLRRSRADSIVLVLVRRLGNGNGSESLCRSAPLACVIVHAPLRLLRWRLESNARKLASDGRFLPSCSHALADEATLTYVTCRLSSVSITQPQRQAPKRLEIHYPPASTDHFQVLGTHLGAQEFPATYISMYAIALRSPMPTDVLAQTLT